MKLELLNLYPLSLPINEGIVTFNNYKEHLKYAYGPGLSGGHYDDFAASNLSLQNWERSKKDITSSSALYKHQINEPHHSDLTQELNKEFKGLDTTLSVGQILFRDTRLHDIPSALYRYYMPTSHFPRMYYSKHEYDVTLVLTIKSSDIKCYYYGNNNNGICEWEVFLQNNLLFTQTNEYIIPAIRGGFFTEPKCYNRTILEFDVTKPYH